VHVCVRSILLRVLSQLSKLHCLDLSVDQTFLHSFPLRPIAFVLIKSTLLISPSEFLFTFSMAFSAFVSNCSSGTLTSRVFFSALRFSFVRFALHFLTKPVSDRCLWGSSSYSLMSFLVVVRTGLKPPVSGLPEFVGQTPNSFLLRIFLVTKRHVLRSDIPSGQVY